MIPGKLTDALQVYGPAIELCFLGVAFDRHWTEPILCAQRPNRLLSSVRRDSSRHCSLKPPVSVSINQELRRLLDLDGIRESGLLLGDELNESRVGVHG
jgi:hypothetical protein